MARRSGAPRPRPLPAKRGEGIRRNPRQAPPWRSPIDDLGKVDLRVGLVKEAGLVDGADKLLKLMVDLGEAEPRQIFTGLRAHYPDPAVLVGRKVAVVANLKPRQMKFGLSSGMILAAAGRVVTFDRRLPQAGRQDLVTTAPRTRFAPSPTGYLHIGGVRTALFNWLFARRHGGQLRPAHRRHRPAAQRRGGARAHPPRLPLAGPDWDEGPEVGGPYAPYFQSQRTARYQAAVDELLARGTAYRDFATAEEMDAERKAAEAEKRGFQYSRRFMAATDGRSRALRGRGPQVGRAPQDAARGEAGAAGSRARQRRVRLARGGRPRRAARRRVVHLPPGQRRRRSRLRRSPTSSAPRSTCRTRRGRCSSPRRWASRCPRTPTSPTSPSPAPSASCPSASSTPT